MSSDRGGNKDVKFVIYQVLYIFVVCVIALKGASLDLSEVIKKENVVEKEYADSLKTFIDSLLALGLVPEINFDTNKKFTNPEELKKQLEQMQQQLVVFKTNNPSLTVNTTSPNINISQTDPQFEKPKEQNPELETEIKEVQPLQVQPLTQFTQNTVQNRGNLTLEIIGSDGKTLASIGPGGSQSFTMGGQSSVTFKQGNQSKTVNTKENGKPGIKLTRLVPAGEDVSVRRVQSTTGYRVEINDDFPGQLDVNFSGPVTVRQAGEMTYDITLNFLKSETQFDNYTDGKDSPYTVGFQISVKDRIAGHSLTQSGIFQFGTW
jgi:hypothetical protein